MFFCHMFISCSIFIEWLKDMKYIVECGKFQFMHWLEWEYNGLLYSSSDYIKF